jgi:predicted ester cyclase
MSKINEKRIRFANDEILGKGNLDVVGDVFSADYIVHASGKDYKGPKFVKKFIKQLRIAIPTLRVEEVAILMQSGNMITWQRTLSGRHETEMKGIPPSGHKVKWIDMVVTRFEGDKIAEEWTVSELAEKLLLKLPS